MRRLQGRALPRLAQEELKRGWTMAPCSAAAAAAAVATAAVAAAASAAAEVPDGNYFVQSPSHLLSMAEIWGKNEGQWHRSGFETRGLKVQRKSIKTRFYYSIVTACTRSPYLENFKTRGMRRSTARCRNHALAGARERRRRT